MKDETKALLLAQEAAQYLLAEDPDLVQGGCADVSRIISDFLKRRGFQAPVVYGVAWKGKSNNPFMHAWLDIYGTRFDPVLWLLKRKLSDYRYEEEPGVQAALECPDDLTYYVDELDNVIDVR